MKDQTIGIYIHIPFCVKKCPYCSFNSIENSDVPEDSYIDALLKELAYYMHKTPDLSEKSLETVYIGGGTPSLISPGGIERLLRGINSVFSYTRQPEVTLEVNPGTVTFEKLLQFKEAGVNRLSLGIQSFSDKDLKSLGRIHTKRDALNCFEYARTAGFNNIGIDLISCIPGQILTEWSSELDAAISLRPEHISAYTLTIEKDTPFFRLDKEGRLLLPSEEEQLEMFELTIDRLTSAGYNHYEVSNYSLEGFESRHNNRYWDSGDYIGLGAGAHSYRSSPDWGVRWWNISLPDDYIKSINNSGQAIAGLERLTEEEAITEGIFLGLRKSNGISYDWFSERFNFSLKESRSQRIAILIEDGLISERENTLRLTSKGLIIADTVITSLI